MALTSTERSRLRRERLRTERYGDALPSHVAVQVAAQSAPCEACAGNAEALHDCEAFPIGASMRAYLTAFDRYLTAEGREAREAREDMTAILRNDCEAWTREDGSRIAV